MSEKADPDGAALGRLCWLVVRWREDVSPPEDRVDTSKDDLRRAYEEGYFAGIASTLDELAEQLDAAGVDVERRAQEYVESTDDLPAFRTDTSPRTRSE